MFPFWFRNRPFWFTGKGEKERNVFLSLGLHCKCYFQFEAWHLF